LEHQRQEQGLQADEAKAEVISLTAQIAALRAQARSAAGKAGVLGADIVSLEASLAATRESALAAELDAAAVLQSAQCQWEEKRRGMEADVEAAERKADVVRQVAALDLALATEGAAEAEARAVRDRRALSAAEERLARCEACLAAAQADCRQSSALLSECQQECAAREARAAASAAERERDLAERHSQEQRRLSAQQRREADGGASTKQGCEEEEAALRSQREALRNAQDTVATRDRAIAGLQSRVSELEEALKGARAKSRGLVEEGLQLRMSAEAAHAAAATASSAAEAAGATAAATVAAYRERQQQQQHCEQRQQQQQQQHEQEQQQQQQQQQEKTLALRLLSPPSALDGPPHANQKPSLTPLQPPNEPEKSGREVPAPSAPAVEPIEAGLAAEPNSLVSFSSAVEPPASKPISVESPPAYQPRAPGGGQEGPPARLQGLAVAFPPGAHQGLGGLRLCTKGIHYEGPEGMSSRPSLRNAAGMASWVKQKRDRLRTAATLLSANDTRLL
jgi:hypothetical protein